MKDKYSFVMVCVLVMVVNFGHLIISHGTERASVTDEATRTVETSKEALYVEMEVSAYCICEKCCGRRPDNPLYGITASGVGVRDFYGLLIAAPPEYPFGTVMEVPGYGIATVADRGGAIKGNKLDILFRTHQEALNWGRKTLMVKVERPVEQ